MQRMIIAQAKNLVDKHILTASYAKMYPSLSERQSVKNTNLSTNGSSYKT